MNEGAFNDLVYNGSGRAVLLLVHGHYSTVLDLGTDMFSVDPAMAVSVGTHVEGSMATEISTSPPSRVDPYMTVETTATRLEPAKATLILATGSTELDPSMTTLVP